MGATYTYQDFEKAEDKATFALAAIRSHESSELYRTAELADLYDMQLNKTIRDYARYVYTSSGMKVEDFTASTHRIASNFFNRLNTQRCMYSLGNGVSFLQPGEDGEDSVKEMLGSHFDHDIKEAAYMALKHSVSFVFWNLDRIHVFPVTEFVPLWDESTGSLRAGIRFWRLDDTRPMNVVVYEEGGYTEYQTDKGSARLVEAKPFRAYKQVMSYMPADDEVTVVGEENYGSLPIVPMWANRLKQSTLVGMRSAIDAYDLIKSGFANDLADCAEIYWLVSNAGGMDDDDLARFRDRLKLQHIAVVNSDDGVSVQPYTQEVPYQAREQLLTEIRNGLYEDFGALDVHTVAAGATNDHIDAAYQPMDENADDFEFWVGECIKQVLALAGIEDEPEFKRNRISNQSEQVQMVVQEAQWLDLQTILRKLPNISAEEVAAIMAAVEEEGIDRFGINQTGAGQSIEAGEVNYENE